MNRNAAVIDFLYRLLNAGVFAGTVILCFLGVFDAVDITWKHGIVLLLSITLFFLIKELNVRQQIYVSLIGLLIFALLFIIVGGEIFLNWISEQRSFAWVFIVAIISCALQLFMEKSFLLKKTAAVAFFLRLLYALFCEQYMPKIGVVFSLFYIVIVLTEFVHINWRKIKSGNYRAFMLWVMPFMMLYFCCLCLAPISDTPYSWQWAKNIYRNFEKNFTIFMENFMHGRSEDMDGAVSGFSDEAVLFSNIRAEDRHIMTIKTSDKKNLSVYLSGKIFDSFDGREWQSINESSRKERLFDTVETAYALERYYDDGLGNYYKNINLEVNYRQFHTNYILAPSKTWSVQGKGSVIKYRHDGADLMFDKKAGYGTEYKLKFLHINMDRVLLYDFLQGEFEENENLWAKTVDRYTEDDISFEDLYAYRESIREQYLNETETSSKIEEWISNVTKDAKTDVEKLFYIEEALTGMTYSTNPGGLPKDVTDGRLFLEYFLLEKKEGYCTHFATAFVLLAGIEGFPARYVQGFCIPMGTEAEKAVYSSMAHAWPEVYIEGRGWIPFEPTPGYGNRRYVVWEIKTDKKDDYTNAHWTIPQGYTSEQTEIEDEADYANLKEKIRWMKYALWVALLITTVGALAFTIDRISEKHRDKKRSLSQKYKAAVIKNFRILEMLGYERADSETYHEFSERIRLSEDGNNVATAFIETYESVLYGTKKAGEGELDECIKQADDLIQILRVNKGRKYIFYHIKLYIM